MSNPGFSYDIKAPIEKALEEESKPKKTEKPKSPLDLKFMDDPILFVREKFALFMTLAKRDPIEAVKFVPEVAGALGVVVAALIAVVIGALGTSSAAEPKAKKAAEAAKAKGTEVKDQTADAASTGAEKAQTEVSKRTTRSSAAAEQ